MTLIEKLVSGGQTGADRSALLWAIENHIPHGGWCPRGRLAEDGELAAVFHLEETPSSGYAQRTEWNVRDSDATVIFSISRSLSGGSLLTQELAAKWNRPWIRISRNGTREPAKELNEFLDQNFVRILNVAGPRESTEPGVADFVTEVLTAAMEG
ncbi:MAG: putative molybdenum carrier protein [Verrucomicrobiales bacterium]|nr:putative molybdenum carrier protein [Verrucomicrobiales bacterium]